MLEMQILPYNNLAGMVSLKSTDNGYLKVNFG